MTKAIAYEFSAAGLEGRELHARLPELRRLHRAQAGKSGTPAPARRTPSNYASDASVVGVIGTFNSGLRRDPEIPILNRAPSGPLGNGQPRQHPYVGLTHAGPGTRGQVAPGKYYPTGHRNYARVVAADDFQGAADATLA